MIIIRYYSCHRNVNLGEEIVLNSRIHMSVISAISFHDERWKGMEHTNA